MTTETRPTQETVVVVHGTWSHPIPSDARWWQPGSAETFLTKLNDALRRRGSAARCWNHCGEGGSYFHWSGDNNWLRRTQAAAALVAYLHRLAKEGWKVHLIAHSHGGNIIVDALHALAISPHAAPQIGRVVTLGTPFLDTLSAIERQRARVRRRIVLTIGLSLLPFIGYPLVLGAASKGSLSDEALWILMLPIGVIFIVLSARLLLIRWRARAVKSMAPIQGLALGSRLDEAWQVLHHVRETENPLALKLGLPRYLRSQVRDQVRRRDEIAKIYGAVGFRDLGIAGRCTLIFLYLGSLLGAGLVAYTLGNSDWTTAAAYFVPMAILNYFTIGLAYLAIFTAGSASYISAYLSPMRGLFHRIGSLGVIPNEVGTYIARGRAWALLQSMALGLDGFRYELPRVTLTPARAGAAVFSRDALPRGAEERALSKRADWLRRHLGDATQTFSKLAVTASDLSALLEAIEKDQSLVHAAYYTDDECIERIADFIAGSDAANTSASSGGQPEPHEAQRIIEQLAIVRSREAARVN